MARIIDDLLDLSRLEAEEAPVREPVAVHLIVAQAVEQVLPAAEHLGVSIEIGDIPKRLTVVGDRRQLVSSVYNLLENAVKYSASGDDGWLSRAARAPNGPSCPSRTAGSAFPPAITSASSSASTESTAAGDETQAAPAWAWRSFATCSRTMEER